MYDNTRNLLSIQFQHGSPQFQWQWLSIKTSYFIFLSLINKTFNTGNCNPEKARKQKNEYCNY